MINSNKKCCGMIFWQSIFVNDSPISVDDCVFLIWTFLWFESTEDPSFDPKTGRTALFQNCWSNYAFGQNWIGKILRMGKVSSKQLSMCMIFLLNLFEIAMHMLKNNVVVKNPNGPGVDSKTWFSEIEYDMRTMGYKACPYLSMVFRRGFDFSCVIVRVFFWKNRFVCPPNLPSVFQLFGVYGVWIST